MFFLSSWIILAVLTGAASNIYNFINRYLLKGNDDATAYAWYTEIIRFIVFSLFAIFDWKLIINQQSFLILLFLGLTEFLGGYFYMKMHSYNQLSISTILSRTRLIWVPILGFFLIHEALRINDYVGILIIFFGVSTIMAPKKLFIDKGAMYANVNAFVIALNVIILKIALPYASISVLNAVMALPSIFLFPFFMRQATNRMRTFIKIKPWLKCTAILISILQLYLFTLALRFGDASKINAVYQGMFVFSVLAGIIFLREREGIFRKLSGAAITVLGVVLLSFS